jgi:prevent-host-death family protein
VDTIAISKFKATCLAVLERVRRTRRAVRITRFGKPVAEIVPPSTAKKSASWIGSMTASARITGDIVGPATEDSEWEALRS